MLPPLCERRFNRRFRRPQAVACLLQLAVLSMHEPLLLRKAVGGGASVQHILYRDYETRSRANLKLVGSHKYAADPTTAILCAAYAVDDEPAQLWLPGHPVPREFVEAAHNPSWAVAAHGDHFETAIERQILALRFGFPLVPLERHRCTMAIALAAGLPARLDRIAAVLELTNRKDVGGERLMHQMSKPRRRHKDEPAGVYWFDDPERLDRLCKYCRLDVEVEREIYGRLSPLSPTEQATWQLSSIVNERGFRVDALSLRLPARLPRQRHRRSMPSSPTSPAASLPVSIK